MESRLVFPAAIGVAVALGVGLSALVPTRMVTAAPPQWPDLQSEQRDFEPGPTYRFAVAPPVDLDPSQPVGPQYELGDDVMGYSVPVATITPEDVPDAPVYVPVNYELSERQQTKTTASMPAATQPSTVNPSLVATIY